MAPKKDKGPAPSSKPAKSGGGKQTKEEEMEQGKAKGEAAAKSKIDLERKERHHLNQIENINSTNFDETLYMVESN
ncbi:hypothetical protein HS088_TW21G01571 [Tripterygium wilfordii]|uniref:Uncharacterized protein n=1 Tax=Tripterygium wilfordii TaxID=458696 RepID=A0A7J7C6M2_TRIWF|nr:hypothetical protein HS088_TW21G01571 [Tripterygium wilfordii]